MWFFCSIWVRQADDGRMHLPISYENNATKAEILHSRSTRTCCTLIAANIPVCRFVFVC